MRPAIGGKSMTRERDRRTFVRTGAAWTAGATAGAILPRTAAAQTPPQTAPGATAQPAAAPKPMTFSPKPLPFDPKKVKGISEKLLVSHYENNYGGGGGSPPPLPPNNTHPTSPT